jgi:hypothetical protein
MRTMIKNMQYCLEYSEDRLGAASPFDPVETDDLWVLPELDEDDGPGLAGLPRADRRQLFDPAEWGRTQADMAAELAALCLNNGAFKERLAGMAQGARQRLAIQGLRKSFGGRGIASEPRG